MRTKVLICAAALAAASAFTLMAQNVYSLNVVGYINIPLVEGFQLIANQLDFDGTGTNNSTANILGTNLPVGSAVYTWVGTTYDIASFVQLKGQSAPAWSPTTYTLNPGQGAWLNIPNGGLAGTASNLTTVGQVNQGAMSVGPSLPTAGGFSLVSSMVPLSGGLQTALGYTPKVGDAVYQWSIAKNNYVINNFVQLKGQPNPTWSPAEPSIGISEGFWINSQPGAVWSNYFIVQ